MTGFMLPASNPWTGVPYGAPVSNPMASLANYGNSIPDYGNTDFLTNIAQQTPVATPIADTAAAGFDWGSLFKGAVGTKEMPGWGGMALGAAQGLANAWMGMQQYGLAKDTLAENKRQFQMNFNAQKKTTNSALEDRQRARLASNPDAYQSVGDYMKQYGI